MRNDLVYIKTMDGIEYFTKDGDILVVMPPPNYKDSVDRARIIMDFIEPYAHAQYARVPPRKCGVIIVMNNILSQDAASRRVYNERTDPAVFNGIAMVVNNPLARAIASFFIGLSRLSVPLRIVDSVDDAIAWFESMRS